MGYLYAGVAGLILILSVTCYIFYQKAAIAERDLKIVQAQYEQVLAVNVENALNAEKQAQREKEDREATAKAITKNKQIDKNASDLKKANHADPEANTPAGRAWDALSERLRAQPSH